MHSIIYTRLSTVHFTASPGETFRSLDLFQEYDYISVVFSVLFSRHIRNIIFGGTLLSNVGTETLHSTHSFIFCNSYLYNVGRVA